MEIEIEGPQAGRNPASDLEMAAAEGGAGAYLTWEDLTAVLPNYGKGPTRRLVNGLTGFALPGRTLAVMGPSGSGKSTFLDSLAGRLCGNVVMSGNILLNGTKFRPHYGLLAYVTQEDVFLGTLTVRETLAYSANLRLSSSTSTRDEIEQTIEDTITQMGLEDCADHMIGNWHVRGISGGEKKRLSIGLELITEPYLLLLDEPTSGLDSASAFFVVQALRNVARSGRTIVSSIHQPSSEVFALFDDLLLLSSGESVYFGPADVAVEFFAEAGFPCPSRRNPSDHFLRCINSDFDQVNNTLMGSQKRVIKDNYGSVMNLTTAEIRSRLLHMYQTSKIAATVRPRIKDFSALGGVDYEHCSEREAKWWKQVWILIKRSSTNMSRDFGYYWLRIMVFIAVSICVGSIFYGIGSKFDLHAMLARGACGGFISGFMTMMAIGGFPSFIEEMKVFHKERLNRHYGVGVFILSNFVSSFPFLVLMSTTSATIIYLLLKYSSGLSHYMFAVIDLLLSIAVIESIMMVIASLVPNFLMGVIVGAGFIGIMMATAGFFRPFTLLPKVFWTYPVSYVNYMAWGLQGAYKNEMIGMEFDTLQPGMPKVKGEVVLTSILGIELNHSKWWDLATVGAILVSYRLLFFLVLKFKERAVPIYRSYYAKTTLHYLNQRASFRRTTLPYQHLQEGLNSPIHL